MGALQALTRPYSRVSALCDGGTGGGLRPRLCVKGAQKFLLGFLRLSDLINRTNHRLNVRYFLAAMNALKRVLLAIASALISAPAQAETAYLVYKNYTCISGCSMSVVTIPISTMDACEEEGARLINSDRFKLVNRGERQRFECIRGR